MRLLPPGKKWKQRYFKARIILQQMQTFFHEGICPIRDIIARVGDKWSLLVMISLSTNGTMRFSDIQKSLGDVSQKMLTVTLKALVEMNLVSRKSYAEIPPRVEYSLTDTGESMMPHVMSLVGWAMDHKDIVIHK